MARVFLIVMDSFGIGGAPDAADYFNGDDSDHGAATFQHIAKACAEGRCDTDSRSGPLHLPNLERLGIGLAAHQATDEWPVGFSQEPDLIGRACAATETSKGKDTISGHWEIGGVPVPFDWGYLPKEIPTLPADIRNGMIEAGDLPGILADRHAEGLSVIEEFGEEHIESGKPIVYTSADSVIQIAAHETHFGLDRLYDLCEATRKLADGHTIGRVIARPFVGEERGEFERTGNRRDYSVPPPEPTVLERLADAGHAVRAIGKVSDIFAHRGVTESRKVSGHPALMEETLKALDELPDGGFAFVNFVDFDQLYGHRRNPAGYAAALEWFDERLPQILDRMRPDDLLIITADHGNDPTWPGSDHTRERVPVLMTGAETVPGLSAMRETFADIGETVASHLRIPNGTHGQPISRV
ncbi:phosphopentomutase [Notoacmeibacter marinus]|uniref:Phosphopentomutase n=1 Tax=Notoacmeibacter marinus TaxID=1876515 RepID=A0A231V2G3_9HYPH|nr:phosphopentomutase [Notoacmeibacter marinus]OXT02375.1 phosphopentomutase [Notoacmeibacter marinus]